MPYLNPLVALNGGCVEGARLKRNAVVKPATLVDFARLGLVVLSEFDGRALVFFGLHRNRKRRGRKTKRCVC